MGNRHEDWRLEDNPDVIDKRDPNSSNGPWLRHEIWPPPEWQQPKHPEGSWTYNDLPHVSQMVLRATHPYSTTLTPAQEDEFLDWADENKFVDSSKQKPEYDWRGYWQATQREGASGDDAKLPLKHWATPYSEHFPVADSKYALPPPPSGDVPAWPPPNWAPGTRPTIPQAIAAAVNPYTTKLLPNEEREFQSWLAATKAPHDPGPKADYDMRGFWLGLRNGDPVARTEINPADKAIHFPDKWKTPNHPTFSNESIYAQPGAPYWQGDFLIGDNGKILADERVPVAIPTGPTTPAQIRARAAAGRAARDLPRDLSLAPVPSVYRDAPDASTGGGTARGDQGGE